MTRAFLHADKGFRRASQAKAVWPVRERLTRCVAARRLLIARRGPMGQDKFGEPSSGHTHPNNSGRFRPLNGQTTLTHSGDAKNKVVDLVQRVKDKASGAAANDKPNISSDPHVTGSRAAKDGEDGSYVGRTGPDVALDVEQSGAEARSEEKRHSL